LNAAPVSWGLLKTKAEVVDVMTSRLRAQKKPVVQAMPVNNLRMLDAFRPQLIDVL
jgi:hypothetical protein